MNMIVGAVAIGGAGTLPSETDSIFGLIDAHRKAKKAVKFCVDEHCRLERELPRDLRRSSVTEWETTIVESDDPRWIACERNLNALFDAETDAALDLIAEPPTTVQGAVALLQYVAEVEVDRCSLSWPDSLEDESGGGPKLGRDWAYYLHKNLAATFAATA